MERILISSCLLGERVRYDGNHRFLDHPLIGRWLQEGRLVPICPEVAGGLPVPRPPAEIVGGSGEGVWRGAARVVNQHGEDVTPAYIQGARRALELARAHRIRIAILKENSPSCGVHRIYNGTFQGTTVAGEGVTAALLRQEGIFVFNEHQLDAVEELIKTLETS